MEKTQPAPSDVDVAVIGAGPAGLMAAEVLTDAGFKVHIFDAMPSAGRKFLMAGKSGLNITNSEDETAFRGRFIGDPRIAATMERFGPQQVQNWMDKLGVPAVEGSSGRVFPSVMKASTLLRAWLVRLNFRGAEIYTRHRWTGWTPDGRLRMETPDGAFNINAQVTIFSLGGASWRRLGADGAWAGLFRERHIPLKPFEASNGGFLVPWSDFMKAKFAGSPVKSVRMTATGDLGPVSSRSEFVVTERGVESGGIYMVGAALRQALRQHEQTSLVLDLAPDVEEPTLAARLSRPRGRESNSNYLRKAANLDGVKRALLYEVAGAEITRNPVALAAMIKALPLPITGMAPIDEAISTAGGVAMEALTDDFMLKDMPGTFCAGEMLDWDAPTGGYLLTACLATGRRAGEGALGYLSQQAA